MKHILLILTTLAVMLFQPGEAKAAIITPPTTTPLIVDYVIIVPAVNAPSLDYYVTQKTSQGFHPKVFTLEYIYANYSAANPWNQIQAFIQDAVNKWGISYVLLVGDSKVIPSYGGDTSSDFLYSSSVILGRMFANDAASVATITTKWADFSSHGWGRSQLTFVGVNFDDETTPFLQYTPFMESYGWGAKHFDYSSCDQRSPDPSLCNKQGLVDAMNTGYGLVSPTAHGQPGYMGLASFYKGYWDTGDVMRMTNGNHLSVVAAFWSCATGYFGNELLAPTSFAWAYQNAVNGGAIVFIGANRTVWSNEAGGPENGFYRSMTDQYLRYGYAMPGVAFSGKSANIYNYFGDPTAKLDLLPAVPDTEPPVITNIQVGAPIYPSQGMHISANVTDNDFVGIYTIQITAPDGTVFEHEEHALPGGSIFATTFYFNETEQVGTYHVQVIAKDISQNQSSLTGPDFTVMADTTPPVIQNVSVTPTTIYTNETIQINSTVTDNAGDFGITEWAQITRPDSTVDTLSLIQTNISSFGGSYIPLKPGTYSLKIFAQDAAGNNAVPYNMTFTVSTSQPPVISDYFASRQTWHPSAGWPGADQCYPSGINRLTSIDSLGATESLYMIASDAVAGTSGHPPLQVWAKIKKPDQSVVTVNLTNVGDFPICRNDYGTQYYFDQAGQYSIVFYAENQSNNVTSTAPIIFTDTGKYLPPHIILPQVIVDNNNTFNSYVGGSGNFTVSATNPQGNPVSFGYVGWLLGAAPVNFNGQTGLFQVNLPSTAGNSIPLTITATDNTLLDPASDQKTITIVPIMDKTAPTTPVIILGSNNTVTSLNASWSSTDPETGIAEYQYKITQDSAGGSVVKDWTSTGTTASVTATGLNLFINTQYYISVQAKNGSGMLSQIGTSTGITVQYPTPHHFTISPLANSIIGQGTSVHITGTAQDVNGIQKVEFYLDGTIDLGPATQQIFQTAMSFTWDTTGVALGNHTLTARAYDNAGSATDASVSVVIADPATPPTVAITSPTNGFTIDLGVPQFPTVSATASGVNGIQKVEFYLDNVLFSTSTKAPYHSSLINTTGLTMGQHTIMAKAYNNAGISAQTSVNFILSETTPPGLYVSSNSPDGSSVNLGQTVPIIITGFTGDNGGIQKVEFYQDGTLLLKTVTLQSFTEISDISEIWDTTGLALGAHTWTAKAYNNAGLTAESTIHITVIPNVPSAPTIGTATDVGNNQATVTFTAPTKDGGSPITGYTVTSSPGDITATGTASPITVTGLPNGTPYTFTVTATNAVGTSDPSAASNTVIPGINVAAQAQLVDGLTGQPVSVFSPNNNVKVTINPPAQWSATSLSSFVIRNLAVGTYNVTIYTGSNFGKTINYSLVITPQDAASTPVGIMKTSKSVTISLPPWQIAASVSGAGGTINPSKAVNVSASASQTFTITPDKTYGINQVMVDGVVVASILPIGQTYTYTFNKVTTAHTITASFVVGQTQKNSNFSNQLT